MERWEEHERDMDHREPIKIAVSDVVRIKSGSWDMTVSRIRKGRALCVYKPYDFPDVKEAWIPVNVLVFMRR